MLRKTINVPIELKTLEGEGAEEGFHVIEGHGGTFHDIDWGLDRIVTGAFDEVTTAFDAKELELSLLWQHDPHQPVGGIARLWVDEVGLGFKALLPKEDTFVKGRVMPQIRAKSVRTLSIGYYALDTKDVIEGEAVIRNLLKVWVFEISLATLAMNDNARITSVKAIPFQDLPLADKNCEWDPSSQVLVPEEACLLEKGRFLIGRKIDGELKAIPRALFRAAAELERAEISEEEKHAVKEHLERYYRKMGLKSPFEGAFRIDCLKTFREMDPRTQERLLLKGIRFSDQGAKAFISSGKGPSYKALSDKLSALARDVKGRAA
jgi:HK97 family phage prohead protease